MARDPRTGALAPGPLPRALGPGPGGPGHGPGAQARDPLSKNFFRVFKASSEARTTPGGTDEYSAYPLQLELIIVLRGKGP